MSQFEFAHPWILLLLPLALLPLSRTVRDTLSFPSLAWLPIDRVGRIAAFASIAFAMLAIASTVIALAAPGAPESQVLRTGRGAEILVLMDRSRSMDMRMMPSDWRTIDPIIRTQQAWARGPLNSKTAIDLLSRFVTERADDRFSLMFFSGGPMLAVPFTQRDHVLQAGITAAGVGVGLNETNVGLAMLAAIEEFEQRPYSGSRIILLVSDGGAHLDPLTQERIASGLMRNRVALYWLYLRSINSPGLNVEDPRTEMAPEIALHRFFQQLSSPYLAYEAEVPEDFERAVSEVGRQQNLPLDYFEPVPRKDYSRYFLALAAFSCLMLLIYGRLQLKDWT